MLRTSRLSKHSHICRILLLFLLLLREMSQNGMIDADLGTFRRFRYYYSILWPWFVHYYHVILGFRSISWNPFSYFRKSVERTEGNVELTGYQFNFTYLHLRQALHPFAECCEKFLCQVSVYGKYLHGDMSWNVDAECFKQIANSRPITGTYPEFCPNFQDRWTMYKRVEKWMLSIWV